MGNLLSHCSGDLLLVVVCGSLLGSVICSDSGTEMSQTVNRIRIGACSLENWSGCLVENIRFKCIIVNFQSLIFCCAHHCIKMAVRVKSDLPFVGQVTPCDFIMSCGIVLEHRMWVVLFTAAIWFRDTD